MGYALLCLVERLDHRHHLLAAVDDILGLLEEVVEHLGLVELLEQLTLEVLLRVAHERERDRLGDHIDHLALDDVEVRVDEELCGRAGEATRVR